jgi:hypothetical protein
VAVEWQQTGFLTAFKLRGKTNNGVYLWSHHLQQKGGVLMYEDLGGHGVELDLSNNHAFGKGFERLEQLANAMKKDQTVSGLRLLRSEVGDPGASWLAGALMKNRTLKELYLGDNNISDDGVGGLAAALGQNSTAPLKTLSLARNRISSKGAMQLADGIRKNRKLTELDLSGNMIDDDGALRFLETLSPENSVSSLEKLDVSGNKVGPQGMQRLAAVFKEQRSPLLRLRLTSDELLTKGGKSDDNDGLERFLVVCSERGVDIRNDGADTEDEEQVPEPQDEDNITWAQDDKFVEVIFKLAWLRETEKEFVTVDFAMTRLKIEIEGVPILDVSLFGKTRRQESTWTMSDGEMKVRLAKADSMEWSALSKD